MSQEQKKDTTVVATLYGIVEEICKHYCRFPDEYTDEDKLIEEHCDQCPLNKI